VNKPYLWKIISRMNSILPYVTLLLFRLILHKRRRL